MTGSYAEIKKVAKAYKMYYSAPPQSLEENGDYLVDHSIYFFLMGPDGQYLAHFGSTDTAEMVAEKAKQVLQNIN